VTGDGHDDLILAHQLGGDLWIYPGDGTGGFGSATVVSTGRNHGDAAFGDIDEDGSTDVVLSQTDNSRFRVVFGTGTGFSSGGTISQGGTPRYIDLLDYDHDTHLDLLTYLASSACLVVRLGDGTGAFSAASSCLLTLAGSPYNALGVTVVDWNQDGFDDIAVADGTMIRIYPTTPGGLGAPSMITASQEVYALDTVDLLQDGVRALVALGPDQDGGLEIFRSWGEAYRVECLGVGEPLATPAAGMQGVSSIVGDFDEDGLPDRVWRTTTLNVALP
jgi:hypothetical protein